MNNYKENFDDELEDLEEYEESAMKRERRENMEALNAMYQSCFGDALALNKEDEALKIQQQQERRERVRELRLQRELEKDAELGDQPRRSTRLHPNGIEFQQLPPNYREYEDDSDSEDGRGKKRRRLTVSFPFQKCGFSKSSEHNLERLNTAGRKYKTSVKNADYELVDWSVFKNPPEHFEGFSHPDTEQVTRRQESLQRIIKLLRTPRPNQIDPKDITQKMIDGIRYESTGKKYIAGQGTCCHQCRQKTMDQKSICRWPTCSVKGGSFCGFCLLKRYGEDVKEVLKDPTWMCPKCRGCCNCSICRNKMGLPPTGILVPFVVGVNGCKSVYHHLCQIEGSGLPCNPFVNIPNITVCVNPGGKRNEDIIPVKPNASCVDVDVKELKTMLESPRDWEKTTFFINIVEGDGDEVIKKSQLQQEGTPSTLDQDPGEGCSSSSNFISYPCSSSSKKGILGAKPQITDDTGKGSSSSKNEKFTPKANSEKNDNDILQNLLSPSQASMMNAMFIEPNEISDEDEEDFVGFQTSPNSLQISSLEEIPPQEKPEDMMEDDEELETLSQWDRKEAPLLTDWNISSEEYKPVHEIEKPFYGFEDIETSDDE